MVIAGNLVPLPHKALYVERLYRPVVYLSAVTTLATAQAQQGTQKNQDVFNISSIFK
jgi:hypothetical protein